MNKSKFAAAPGQKCCPRDIDILLFGTRQCQTRDGWFNARPDFLGLSLLKRRHLTGSVGLTLAEPQVMIHGGQIESVN